ncbi:MAG: PfkB family carbohydrate kinase [Candidatus Jorgensenbacteria bacterium]
MAQKNKITIISTFATDQLVSENGFIIDKQNGGPAFYLNRALKNEGVSFAMKTGPKMKVQILITRKGEFGRVLKRPTQKGVRFSQIKTPLLLISSVLDEFDLMNLSTFKGRVFLDVQGYVRNGDDFGKKKFWKPNKEVFANIFCLKGTKEELQNMPKQYVEAQKQKLLLITDGKLGCEIFAFGKRHTIKPSKIITSKNTIGAGDTFFAYFVLRYAKTAKVLDSAKYAVKKTSAFLSAQNKHHHNQLFLEEIGCG